LIFLIFILTSCKHEGLVPPLPGDVSYSRQIAPVMKSGCAYSGCHNSNNNLNFPLEKYNDLIDYGGVVPYKPLDSDLYDVIARRYMPPGTTKLSLADQKLIYNWINKSALDK
jgi:hypothetical protein